MRIITAQQAASVLGVAYSTVTLHCRKLGVPRLGKAWIIDEEALERLRASIVGKRGNPNWQKD